MPTKGQGAEFNLRVSIRLLFLRNVRISAQYLVSISIRIIVGQMIRLYRCYGANRRWKNRAGFFHCGETALISALNRQGGCDLVRGSSRALCVLAFFCLECDKSCESHTEAPTHQENRGLESPKNTTRPISWKSRCEVEDFVYSHTVQNCTFLVQESCSISHSYGNTGKTGFWGTIRGQLSKLN